MRNRDYFLPSVTTLILFGLVWFLSCAHQNRFRDEEDWAFEQAAEQQLAENREAEEQPTEETASESAEALVNSDEVEKSEQAQNLEQNTELSEQVAAETSPKPTEGEEPKTEMPLAQTEPEVQMEEAPKPIVRPAYTISTPKIPRRAFLRKGSKVNRFYFARKGDSPKKISELLYSSSKFAKKLSRWNGSVWTPGQVIFYVSPLDPKDKKMASFYQERGIQPEEYQVRSGDWLTRIAHKKLGSVRSWKELAVLNGLKTPNSIESGQTLAVYPKNLFKALEAPTEQKLAKAEEAPRVEPPKPEPLLAKPAEPPPVFENKAPEPAPSLAPAPVTPPPTAAQAPAIEEPEAPAEEAGNVAEQPSEAMNWNQLVEQNSIAILIGAALIILLLALAARKKRLKNRGASSSSGSTESTEDTPSKFRRR